MKRTPFITVEGPIGVGKTSLTNAIAKHFNFHILNEIVEENPFLGKFYNDIEEWSFQTEMFFLCNRYKQLEDINRHFIMQHKPVVADYHIFKNIIFAERTLQPSQYEKYLKIYSILTEDMPVPNMIIYIKASLNTLLRRISIRGRDIEKNIDPVYLNQLIHDYETFLEQFKHTNPQIPILTFDGDLFDFVSSKHDLDYMLKQIENTLQKGDLQHELV
ncbi:deoxynucleoside kinase [Bacillus sp. Marseille-P3661]|uniref:deoxynucleoside kinase n=1 Tax=Bacillus sp. Marseille-P3661 TaxID=1936234 RepID=UPI000C858AF8|nr:deoxynucleoside kinase [Bacillus sp. Marseille-P3661]